MSDSVLSLDAVIFGAFPYAAIALLCAGTIERLVRHPGTLTSRSSQFLENRRHFWAMVPFHVGILVVLAAHLAAFAAPAAFVRWNASLPRLYALEIAGLACGLLAAGGLALALVRRAFVVPVRRTTSPLDWIVLMVLLVQLLTGIGVAVSQSWGAAWFGGVAAPYLWSIVRLHPDVGLVAGLPVSIKVHVAGAWLLVAAFPFTRLVHVIEVPIPYLWRPLQIVRWRTARVVPLEKRP